MTRARRKHWGWGMEHQQPSVEQIRAAAPALAERLGVEVKGVEAPAPLADARLRPTRLPIPAELAAFADAGEHTRARHALGSSYSDVVRGFRGRFEHAPDFVATPGDEHELERVLEWCAAAGVAAIAYGGGTSVVGGVTPDVGGRYNGAVSVDMGRMGRMLEIDAVSRSAHIEAGALGPALEEELRAHGLTLRHFPQSFELSTLGGWIATRAGGHFATVRTHIEDFVESVRAITPTGVWESRRLPGSGAGPSPDRLLAGSEGTLGVITSAWMRVQPRPLQRRSAGVRFAGFLQGAECLRAIVQSGLSPANCRLLDAGEAALTMAGDGSHALLVLGFESVAPDGRALDAEMAAALALCAEHGGSASGGSDSGSRQGARDEAVSSWREAFLGAPYVRDMLIAIGVISETFETAVTWERFGDLHERVTAAVEHALAEVCGGGRVFCRFTHLYPDGPAPYFTVIAPARRGEEVEQWAAVKAAASEAVLAAGGTITHHHAVGRDHRPWYDRQRPEPFAAALRGAKAALDPAGIMNPGVLVDAPR